MHGDAGDVLGYGMRGGRVYVKGDVGYRVGIHMKAYENLVPIMVCGGNARDFFGEYMAGGMLVLLGHEHAVRRAAARGQRSVGAGMHGGVIYLRGTVESWQVGKECGIFTADEDDMGELEPVLRDWCEAFGRDLRRGPVRAVHEARARVAPAVREALREHVVRGASPRAARTGGLFGARRKCPARLGNVRRIGRSINTPETLVL